MASGFTWGLAHIQLWSPTCTDVDGEKADLGAQCGWPQPPFSGQSRLKAGCGQNCPPHNRTKELPCHLQFTLSAS
jgi:hypothetical protein